MDYRRKGDFTVRIWLTLSGLPTSFGSNASRGEVGSVILRSHSAAHSLKHIRGAVPLVRNRARALDFRNAALLAGADIEYGASDEESVLGADAQSGRSQCWSFRREQLLGARKVIRLVHLAMRVQRDVHGGTSRHLKITQPALKRQSAVGPGNGAVHSSEHPS